MKSTAYTILIVSAFFVAQSPALSQAFPGGFGGGGGGFGGGGGGAAGNGIEVRDTTDIYYFFADNPAESIPYGDSLLGNFQQYDPLRQAGFDQANLGYLGSAHRPLFFRPKWRRGFDVGLHQYDKYQVRTSDVRFYRIGQATTQAGHSQGATQNDGYTFIRFSRNFADGVNLSLESRRINNLGAYDFQQSTLSDVAVGLWYHNKFGNYDGFFSFVSNSVSTQDNGGIRTGEDTTFTDAFQVDMNLTTANTRHSNKEVAYTQYFYLNKIFSEASMGRRQKRRDKRQREKEERRLEKERRKSLRDSTMTDSTLVLTDSLGTIDSVAIDSSHQSSVSSPQSPVPNHQSPVTNYRRTFTLYHQIAWRRADYKFSAKPVDSLSFGDDFWVDDRGLRHFVETRKLENTIKLQTFKLRERDGDGKAPSETTATQRDLLEVGLTHSMYLLDQEPRDTPAIHNVFLTGRFNFSPGERLRVRTYAHLGLAANAGDFRLSGELFFDLKKIGNLRVEVVNQLFSSGLIAQRFFVSEQQIWKNNFSKTLETSLMGTYSLPSANASVSGQYHLTSNLIYFDSLGLPRQKGSVANIFQLVFRTGFHLGKLHSENWAGLQESTSDVLRLPSFYSKHSLYLEGKIFKGRMHARLGADARLTTSYAAPGYQPLTGQFFLSNAPALPFTPLVDGWLSFRVKTFRFFFKVENTLSFFTKKYYFQTAGYPQPFGFGNGGLRMGIHWRLVD